MAIPSVTALISGAREQSYPASDLSPTKTITLSGAATNDPILEWEWSIIATDANNPGGCPADSGLLTGTHGDFVNGKSSVQNPDIPVDVIGGYCFSLRARNADGWSDPELDGTASQAIAFILTERGMKIPPANMKRYENSLNESLKLLHNLNSGASGIITSSSIATSDYSQVATAKTWYDLTTVNPITITTVEGEYILVSYASSLSSGTTATLLCLKIVVDSTDYQLIMQQQTYGRNMSQARIIGPLSAGSHTIKIQVLSTSSATITIAQYTADGYYCAPVLYVAQFRGGLIPIQSDGVAVLDKPAAINFTDGIEATDVGGIATVKLSSWKFLGEDTTIGLNALTVYQFDGSADQLKDRTSTSYDLNLISGTLSNMTGSPIEPGLLFQNLYLTANLTEDLRLIGAMSIECIFRVIEVSAGKYLICCAASGENLKTNFLYSWKAVNPYSWECFTEYGVSGWDRAVAPFGIFNDRTSFVYVVMTRNAAGYYKFYCNGILTNEIAIGSPEKDTPANNLQYLSIGGGVTSATCVENVIVNSIRILDYELTANQVLDIYNEVKP